MAVVAAYRSLNARGHDDGRPDKDDRTGSGHLMNDRG